MSPLGQLQHQGVALVGSWPSLIVHEDVKTLGLGAELSAVIMEERFDALDAPVRRLTSPDTHCAFSHVLEKAILPDADGIVRALRELAEY